MAKSKQEPKASAHSAASDQGSTPAATAAEDSAGRAAEIVDELGLDTGIEISPEIAQKIAQQVALSKFKTKVTWYVFRAKAGENQFRNVDGSPKLSAIADDWPNFAKTLTVSARDSNALRYEAAERAVVEYFEEHNKLVDAGESGLIAAAVNARVTVPRGYKGADADREGYAEQFLASPDRFGERINRHVGEIKAEREVKRKAAAAAKEAASKSVKVSATAL